MGMIAKRTDVSDCTTVDAILDKSGLNWEPELRKATYADGACQLNKVSDKFRAVVNPLTGESLSYVGAKFRPNSHVRSIHSIGGLVSKGALVPRSVSVWNGGEKIAFNLQVPDVSVRVGERSIVTPVFTLLINHDSTGSDRAFFSDFDLYCKNQMGMVDKVGGVGVRHMSEVRTRYDQLVESRIMSLGSGEQAQKYDLMRKMSTFYLGVDQRSRLHYFARVMGLDPQCVTDAYMGDKSPGTRTLEDIERAYLRDDHGVPGSIWHAYSAVTRFTTHQEGRNEASRSLRSLTGLQSRYHKAFSEAVLLMGAA